MPPIVDQIRNNRFIWLGYVLRRKEEGAVRVVVKGMLKEREEKEDQKSGVGM